jgi:amidase
MPVGGLNAAQAKAMASAIDLLKTAGATVIDPVEIPSIVATDPSDNALLLGICYDLERGKSNDKNCSVILKYGMKRDFNKWLDSLGESAPVTSLTGLRNFNTAHQAAGAIRYGQAQLDISDEMDVEADAARFRADRDKDLRLARTEGLDVAWRKHELDAFLMPPGLGKNY